VPVKEIYESALVNRGRRVRVLDPNGPFEGTAAGITDTGELLVETDGGAGVRKVDSGEVSVRGVMGYV
jgi:BirA family biotin operon repressor/biotin-[acetyl-CoA-carboxylase] ligase